MQKHPVTNSVLAVITNSGTTNMPGSTLTINHDGSGSLTYQKRMVSLLGVGEMWNEHNSQKLLDRPNVISEPSSHSRCALVPTPVF